MGPELLGSYLPGIAAERRRGVYLHEHCLGEVCLKAYCRRNGAEL